MTNIRGHTHVGPILTLNFCVQTTLIHSGNPICSLKGEFLVAVFCLFFIIWPCQVLVALCELLVAVCRIWFVHQELNLEPPGQIRKAGCVEDGLARF